MDLLSMWIDGDYDDLFAALRKMTFAQRIREVHDLIRDTRQFDADNSDEGSQTDELPRFLDECIARLA